MQPENGIGDLFKDSATVKQKFSDKPPGDIKHDIVNLFEKVKMSLG